MPLPKKGNRPRGDFKRWRDEVFKSPHIGRYCVICSIDTIFERKEKYSFCLKCSTFYNRIGTKLLTYDEMVEVSE